MVQQMCPHGVTLPSPGAPTMSSLKIEDGVNELCRSAEAGHLETFEAHLQTGQVPLSS